MESEEEIRKDINDACSDGLHFSGKAEYLNEKKLLREILVELRKLNKGT